MEGTRSKNGESAVYARSILTVLTNAATHPITLRTPFRETSHVSLNPRTFFLFSSSVAPHYIVKDSPR
jgi:hypothetical protein